MAAAVIQPLVLTDVEHDQTVQYLLSRIAGRLRRVAANLRAHELKYAAINISFPIICLHDTCKLLLNELITMFVLLLDIAIAAVDLLQEMTDVEITDDSDDSVNSFIDALVSDDALLRE